MRILIVEDDECIAKTLLSVLGNQHYTVDVASDGNSGWELIETFSYDLILLDVMLPKLDGLKICQRLRSKNYQTPILLLTAKNSNTDKVEGLEAGADDYVVKPFEFSELLARIRVLLRRRNLPIQTVLRWENLCLYPDSCEVTYNDNLLTLTPKEYRLLELFLGLAEGSRLAKQIEQMFKLGMQKDQTTVINLCHLVELLQQELNKPVFEEFDKAVLNFVEEEDSVK